MTAGFKYSFLNGIVSLSSSNPEILICISFSFLIETMVLKTQNVNMDFCGKVLSKGSK